MKNGIKNKDYSVDEFYTATGNRERGQDRTIQPPVEERKGELAANYIINGALVM